MTNLGSILKSRDLTLLKKVRLVFFCLLFFHRMWALGHNENWAPKGSFFQIIMLEDSWESLTARRSNQSILKEINPEYSLEGLFPKLNLQYFGHLMWRADSFEKTLMLGKIEGRRRRGWQGMRYHRLNGHEIGWALAVGDEQGGLACCGSWGRKVSDTTEWLNWLTESGKARCPLSWFLRRPYQCS